MRLPALLASTLLMGGCTTTSKAPWLDPNTMTSEQQTDYAHSEHCKEISHQIRAQQGLVPQDPPVLRYSGRVPQGELERTSPAATLLLNEGCLPWARD